MVLVFKVMVLDYGLGYLNFKVWGICFLGLGFEVCRLRLLGLWFMVIVFVFVLGFMVFNLCFRV